ncbi:MAG TPA: M3 family oligoendopeptidase [Thermomicrobiales bacterium]|nr:M3 family oligoendopeptidase [Thermomicrobiales bacterium]
MTTHETHDAPRPLDPADWATVQPEVDRLLAVDLAPGTVEGWLKGWSDLQAALDQGFAAAMRAANENTADEAAERAFLHYVEEIQPRAEVASQALRRKLLDFGAYRPPADQETMLRRFTNAADLFRDENVPLLSELEVLANEYNKLVGAMAVTLDGAELTLPQAELRLLEPDRAAREAAWRAIQGRWLRDRAALDDLYLKMLPLRRRLARNAGLPDYRAFVWRQYDRFDYTPEDTRTFHDAIAHAVVPLASRLLAERAAALGGGALRPWDLDVDPESRPPLRPFDDAAELEAGTGRIFDRVDPALGREFARLRQDDGLDLASRPNKAPGGYSTGFPLAGHAYIFMNAAGSQDDVNTLLHEGGHAFHFALSSRANTLVFNYDGPIEFCEVASMAMELLAAPYLERERGGFYDEADARRARADHLRGIVAFLPYMAVVDAFQHWVYTEAPEAPTARDLDRAWGDLWARFMPGVDWGGLEEERVTGWHRKVHLYGYPFYYVEYGLAQLGALQVWRNALADQQAAVAAYRRALALGNTRSLPDLFAAAGARFAFDRATVGELMALVGERIVG